MQKIQPAKNNLDMDFLNSFDKPIGGTVAAKADSAVTQNAAVKTESENTSDIDLNTDFSEEISLDDEVPVSKAIKTTQIVVRTTEKERNELKAYFMKHGISISKGLKIAVKYLQQQEKKGQVRFSDIGLY